ncbi:DUF421 domain-containing protein [Roseiconus lacunae]|uniref:DUF421 domain-containing protein n=1 Tax=Roseiconus lacunae TaxID=2605694 RepID=UPI001E4CA959|nr:YetF domain-containing protein [Roseiconus lacunae]MCD0462784.1 DUF421 domain-containing protein [Roseiconus lacunae]
MIDQKMFFDGWAPLLRTTILGTLAYIALIMMLRVSGKRTLSKMNAFDFVVTVAFGSTLATVLISRDVSLAQGVVALALLIVLQLVCTFLATRSASFQRLIKAQPTLIFFRGRYLDDVLRRQRVTQEEVVAAIRSKGIADPESVDAVVIESEGTLTVIADNAGSVSRLSNVGVEVDQPLTGKRDFRKAQCN